MKDPGVKLDVWGAQNGNQAKEISSKILALSMSSAPGGFEGMRGRTTRLECFFGRAHSSTSTARRINSLSDRFSRAAFDLSSRYKASGMSTVVRTSRFCHIMAHEAATLT